MNTDTEGNMNTTNTNTNNGATTNTDTTTITQASTMDSTNTNATTNDTTSPSSLPGVVDGVSVGRDISSGPVTDNFISSTTMSSAVFDGIFMHGNYSDIEAAYNQGDVTVAGVPDFETEYEMACWIIQRCRRLLDNKSEIVRHQISMQYPHWIAGIAKAYEISSEDACALCIIRYSARVTYETCGSCCDEHKKLLRMWFMPRNHH
ncbi:hypothetical protein BZA77DRAFT_289495 [Pyronema omphalodes]|nr:hypothetical protein BZA77DRAFT_289495 [Pyronema omphalodes]